MDFSTPKTYKTCGVATQNVTTRKREIITYTRKINLRQIPMRKNTNDRAKIHSKRVFKTWAFLIRHSGYTVLREK